MRLSITFHHAKPLALGDFAHALSRLDARYGRFSRSEAPDETHDLFIANIREGSTIVDLTEWAPIVSQTLSAIGGVHTVAEFAKDVSGLLSGFRTQPKPSDGFTVTDCDDVRALVKPSLYTEGGGLTIAVNGDNNVVNPILLTLGQPDLQSIDNAAALTRLALQQQNEATRRHVLLTWFQVRDAPGSPEGHSTPDRAVIHEISDRAVPVRFSNPNAKEAMIGGDQNPFHRGYIVDVKVLTGPRGLSGYLVLEVHDTIPLETLA